ncbi:Peptidoglycan/LPS O-acetylase OafA/YrhL, contains acyltransferase and SGNH-hydrolase domains [Butyrivibrio fibrisolvens DSM 3071]|uniref:Peptidoglycan/LPS O-acetylase OafA/YrhL, contains acyltransferase and SGNH-hydrolase domains n=1 Tax=Butyrivibrio fibrisolvens DSM 3071 TaxID=1121131 RepID=A0A1M6DIW5_BUTFI|nr:acyltransferase family protein [Butyrivibrio fibrisolvens]SHI73132.1 Peptidoglycan/LPS O-acetylase OafA/YrhL, contains acyltransferase and SGNH-hydrolase domains [Butyrivibrio fibrisolvens DSM 3071]
MAEKTKSRRNGRIEILRFVFAFIVLLHHSRYLLGDDNCYFLGGSLGVEFFFIVSGYLMMNTVDRIVSSKNYNTIPVDKNLANETASFIKKKVQAILPQFPIAWFIGLLFVIILNHMTIVDAFEEFKQDFWELSLLKMTGIYYGGLDGVMWYISSMLICMTILYPLLRRFPHMMRKIWCPFLALMFLGMMCILDGHPRNPTKVYSIIYKGNIRAFAEICIGIWSYDIVRKIKSVNWSKLAGFIFEILQLAGYGMAIIYMYSDKPGKDDYFFLMVLSISIILSFAQVGILSDAFNNRFSMILGRFSAAMYFSHLYYAQNLNLILEDSLSKQEKTLIYIACSFVTALVVEALAFLYKKVSPNFKRGLKAILVKNEKDN